VKRLVAIVYQSVISVGRGKRTTDDPLFLTLGRLIKNVLLLDIYTQMSIFRYLSMSKTDSLQGSLDLLVLKILSRRPRLHGYAIMSAIAEMSGDVLHAEEGSLYPALHRMEEAGWIRAEWIRKDSGRRARIYELTAAGKKQLAAEESRWQVVTSAVNRILRTV
jgi:PadR family transcriptional regulator